MKILLGDFSAKVGRLDIFKPATENKSIQEISNEDRVPSRAFVLPQNTSMPTTELKNAYQFSNISVLLLVRSRHITCCKCACGNYSDSALNYVLYLSIKLYKSTYNRF
jgi:hypothetical protein